MIKIIKKGKRLYELIDDNTVLGILNYLPTSGLLAWLENAQIRINNDTFNIKHIYNRSFLDYFNYFAYGLNENHTLILSNNFNKKISDLKFFRHGYRSDYFNLEEVSITLNNINYHLSAKSKIFRLFSGMSSSYSWYDSKQNEVMSFTTTKGFPSTTEVLVETNLNLKDSNTRLLAFWGFYLLPKTLTSIASILVAFILCPLLLYVLIKVFIPYF